MSSNIVDEIVIRVRADLEKFKGEIIGATGSVKKFEDSAKSAGVTTQKLDTGLKAFSWTTFSQGALNTSTALAQLYTSISNIAKIQYTLKAAIIGVERAEDLVARKTLQLTKEVEKNGIMSRTAILLRNELATASEDLAVKNERVAIAQDAVNDTYILFTSNVVNTVFGTMQTLVGLKAMLVTKSLAVKAAQAQETASITVNSGAIAQNTINQELNNAAVSKRIGISTGLVAGVSAYTAALTTQNAAMAASNVGLGTVSSGMGLATRITGGLTSALGKAGLVGSLAATGVAVGALVYDQIQLGNETNKLIESVDELTKKYINLGSTISDTSKVIIDESPFTGAIQTQINQIDADIEEMEQKLKEIKVSPQLFSFPGEQSPMAKAGSDLVKSISNAKNEQKDYNDELDHTIEKYDLLIKGLESGDFKGVPLSIAKEFDAITSKVSAIVSVFDDLTPATEDFLEQLTLTKTIWMEELNIGEDLADVIIDHISSQKQLNNLKSQGNEISRMGWEQEKKYLKEIADLKKKQDPIYQKRSLFSGILGLEEDFLEGQFGKEIASHLGYQPFMGVISKRNNEVKMITDLIRLDNQLYGYTNMLEELMVILPGVSDPAQRKQITDTIIALRDNISKVKSEAGPSISSSNKTIAGFARQYTQAIGQLQNNLRSLVSHGFGSFPTFGGQDRLSQYYTNQMRSITGGAGALARSMVERTVVNRNTILASIRGVNTSRIGSVQRTTVSVPGYGDLSVKKRGGKGAYRTRQIGINMANQEYSYQLQQLTGYSLSELQSLTGLEIQHVDPDAVLWNALGSGRSNRNQFVTPQMAQQRSDYVRNYMERLERNRAEVSSRISLITELTSINPYLSLSLGQGSTELSSILKEQENLLQLVGLSKTQAKEIVVTPTRGRTEIDDRIRWTQRLEQISTGATVF